MRAVAAYHHPSPEATTQEPDPRPGHYYVSARRQDGMYVLLAGPYPTHAEALAAVAAARSLAWDTDPRAPWYAYGTCRMEDPGPGGIFNAQMGPAQE